MCLLTKVSCAPRLLHSLCCLQYKKHELFHHVPDVEATGREEETLIKCGLGDSYMATQYWIIEPLEHKPLDDREHSRLWQSLRRVGVEKCLIKLGMVCILLHHPSLACTEHMSTIRVPSILLDCIAYIQWSWLPIHAAASEIFCFSPFNTISSAFVLKADSIVHG